MASLADWREAERATAIHEAGHVRVAMQYDWAVSQVSLSLCVGGGVTISKRPAIPMFSADSMSFKGKETTFDARESTPLGTMLCAGFAAQLIWCSDSPTIPVTYRLRDFTRSRDYDNAWALASCDHLTEPDETIVTWINLAIDFLREHWEEVESIADALIEKRTLTYPDILYALYKTGYIYRPIETIHPLSFGCELERRLGVGWWRTPLAQV